MIRKNEANRREFYKSKRRASYENDIRTCTQLVEKKKGKKEKKEEKEKGEKGENCQREELVGETGYLQTERNSEEIELCERRV